MVDIMMYDSLITYVDHNGNGMRERVATRNLQFDSVAISWNIFSIIYTISILLPLTLECHTLGELE